MFIDYLKEVQREMAARFPKAKLVYFAQDEIIEQDKTQNLLFQFGYFGGNFKEVEEIGRMCAKNSDDAMMFCADIFIDWIANVPNRAITLPQLGAIKDAAIDYAAVIGRNVSHAERYKPKVTRITHEEQPRKTSGYEIGQKVEQSQLEETITMVQDELTRLLYMRKPESIIPMLKGEAKRLRRQGRLKEAQAKEDEAARIVAKAQEQLNKLRRKAQLREQRIAWLAEARKVQATRREEEARKRAEAERDRQRSQFDPHRAAKAKMARMKAEKAERKARKRRASSES